MESSIDKTRKTIAAVVKGKSGKAGKMSLRDCQKSMKGKCYRCGDPSHMSAECKKEKVTCNACGKDGHLSKVCFKRMMGNLGGDKSTQQGQGRKEARSRAKKEKAAKVSQSAPAKPACSDTEEEGEEGNCSQAAILRHKLFQASTEVCKTIINPTPRLWAQICPKDRGTPFRFEVLPDTGCTTSRMS